MQVREFTGAFELDGVTGEEMTLRVILSTGAGGEEHGSGSFLVPPALVGQTDGEMVFRIEDGESLTIEVREVDMMEGAAYFLTTGAVPVSRGVKVA